MRRIILASACIFLLVACEKAPEINVEKFWTFGPVEFKHRKPVGPSLLTTTVGFFIVIETMCFLGNSVIFVYDSFLSYKIKKVCQYKASRVNMLI